MKRSRRDLMPLGSSLSLPGETRRTIHHKNLRKEKRTRSREDDDKMARFDRNRHAALHGHAAAISAEFKHNVAKLTHSDTFDNNLTTESDCDLSPYLGMRDIEPQSSAKLVHIAALKEKDRSVPHELQRAAILDLPYDIRDMIYRLLFSAKAIVILSDRALRGNKASLQPLSSQFMAVCKQVHQEALPYLYGQNAFLITPYLGGPPFEAIARVIGTSNLAYIRKLTVDATIRLPYGPDIYRRGARQLRRHGRCFKNLISLNVNFRWFDTDNFVVALRRLKQLSGRIKCWFPKLEAAFCRGIGDELKLMGSVSIGHPSCLLRDGTITGAEIAKLDWIGPETFKGFNHFIIRFGTSEDKLQSTECRLECLWKFGEMGEPFYKSFEEILESDDPDSS